jgi:hypothetical protein
LASLLLRSATLPQPTLENSAAASAIDPASAVRWLWPVLKSIPPPEPDTHKLLVPRDAARMAGPPAAVSGRAKGPYAAGWGLVEGDNGSSTGVSSSATPNMPPHSAAVAADRGQSHDDRASVPAKRPLVAREGQFSLIDSRLGTLRSELTWIPTEKSSAAGMTDESAVHESSAAAVAADPVPDRALTALSGALHNVLSSVLESQQSNRGVDCRRFYPSSLAVLLTRPQGTDRPSSGASGPAPLLGVGAPPPMFHGAAASLAGGDGSGGLLLVVEKNFKVYAYTTQDLHLALLALFCKVRPDSCPV